MAVRKDLLPGLMSDEELMTEENKAFDLLIEATNTLRDISRERFIRSLRKPKRVRKAKAKGE